MNAEPDAESVAPPPPGRRRTALRHTRRHPRRIGVLAVAAALVASGCAAGQVSQTAEQKATIDGVNAEVGNIDLRSLAIERPPTGLPAYPVSSDATLKVVLVNKGTGTDTLTSIRTRIARTWANFADYNDAYRVQQQSLAQATGSGTPAPSSSAASPSDTDSAPTDSGGPSGADSAPSDGTDGSAPSTGGSSRVRSRSASPSETVTPEPLPTGTRSVVIAPGGRVGFATPEAKGAILLIGLTQRVRPGDSVAITLTFAKAGSITVDVPVQLSDGRRGPTVGSGEDEGGE